MRSRILTVLAVGALVFTACGDDDDGASTQPAATGGGAPVTTGGAAPVTTGGAPPATTGGDAVATTAAPVDTTGSDGTPAGAAASVAVSENEELGEYLVDAEGRTLYLFELDEGLTSACTGGCADNWPPLDVAEPAAGDGVDQSLLETAATDLGENHVAYNGHLLYYFAGDAAPGDTAGTAVPEWYAVSPAGEAIEVGQSGLTSDLGYDY